MVTELEGLGDLQSARTWKPDCHRVSGEKTENLKIIVLNDVLYASLCGHMYIECSAHRGWRRASNPLDLMS